MVCFAWYITCNKRKATPVIEHNHAAALYESQARIALAASRASLLASLGAIDTAAPPAPLARREYRRLLETVELRRDSRQAA